MKEKILVVAFLVICMSLAAYGTLAYFSYETTVTNVITTGNVRIAIEEWETDSDGALVPFKGEETVMPGLSSSHIVRIKNTGNSGAWVRVSVEKSIVLAEEMEGEADLSLVSMDLNTDYWTEQDGYYYYNLPLNAGETTEPLFSAVFFSKDMGNLYQGSRAFVEIKAQATQTANNGTAVLNAAGWPVSE